MRCLFLRCGAVLLLLFAGVLTLGAQDGATPAARQQAADRRFLLERGLGPAGSTQASGGEARPAFASGAARRVQAARARKTALAAAQTRVSRAAAQPFLNTSTTTWQSAGPIQLQTPAYGLVTGRVSSLAVDPSDATGNTLYLGATGGGVWKSTNAAGDAGSITFQPKTDNLPAFQQSPYIPSLSIGAITVNPNNAQNVLAGTGDPNDALDSYYGAGVLRSTNGGNTWTQVYHSNETFTLGYNYSFVGAGFAGFAWSGKTPNLVVAAVSQSIEGLLVDVGANGTGSPMAGLFYSTDSGQTWYLATITDGTNRVVQSSNKHSSPPGNAATSVVWDPQRQLFLAAVRFHGYYSSSDGMTWTRLANQPGAKLTTTLCPANPNSLGSPSCPIFRGVLAVQPATGDVFALTTDLNNVDQGLYQDICSSGGTAVSSCNTNNSVTFGTKINDAALDAADGTIAQADYNLTLSAVASQQDTLLFAGTEDIFRCSLANSCQWRNTTNIATCASAHVAPSMHAIDGTFGGNGLVYFGNDGGLWRTTDSLAQTGSACASTDASHFDNLNGGLGSLAEIGHLAVSPTNGSLVLAGMGEFGIVGSESAAAQGGTGAWQQLLTGEGSYVAIDSSTPANWYADALAGVGIFDCSSGGNCAGSSFGTVPAIGRTQVEKDTDDNVVNGFGPAPWILDPGNPANILLGTCRLWLGPASGGWSGANLISSMLDGDGGPYCNGNAVLRSVAAGGSYNSGGEQMYAGMAGPLDGGGGNNVPGHIYGATVAQGGGLATWSDLWRNPVTNESMTTQFNPTGDAISSIAVDPHDSSGKTIYAGIAGFPVGQGGVLYGSTDGGAHWANMTNTLPFEPVNKVVVDPNNGSYVYVGGDFGVYYTSNIGLCATTGTSFQNCWTQLASGLPNAPVTDLQVYSSGGVTVLEAATYGRGIWTLGLTTSSVPAQASLAPASASLGSAGVGSQSSTTAPFTLSNTGNISLTIGQIAAAPASDYTQTNNCGSALAPGANCTIQVAFTPSTTGDRPGSLTVHASTQSGVLTATLDGTGLTPGAIAVTPNALSFPTTSTGSNSAPMSVQIQNTGQATVQLKSRSISGTNSAEFSLGTGSTCGSSLSANATCTVPVVFTPSQPGTRTAQLQIVSSGNTATVGLSGSAVNPAHLTLTPTSLPFPDTGVGSISSSETITVQNTGGAAAQLGSGTVSSDYRITSNGCGTTLAGGASCAISVAFAPSGTGSRSGLFTQPASNIPAGQVTAPLSGNGLPAPVLTLSPNSLSFGSQRQGTSAAQTITISNSGGSSAQFGAIAANDNDFTVSANSCGSSLANGSSCQVTVTFTPAGANPYTAMLTVPYSSTSAAAQLSGTGTAQAMLQFNPSSLSFPATADNATSAVQTVTVTNTGGNPASISGFAVSGPFGIANNTCPASLPVGGQCTVGATFSPPGTASYTGALTLSGNFSNSPAAVGLAGQGANPANATLNPSSMAFPGTPEGSASAVQTFTVTSTGGVAVMLGAPSVSTNDYQISSNNCPSSLSAGNSCQIAVLFHPGSTGVLPAAFQLPGNMPGSPLQASLSGTGTPPGVLTITPGSIQFGSRATGTASAGQTATVRNTGGSSVTLGAITAAPSDYAITSTTCGTALAPNGGSCSVTVVFNPGTAGDRPGQLTIPGDGAEASAVTTLDGTGTTPGQLVFSPQSVAFGNVATDSTKAVAVTVANSGGTPVQISSIAASGDFSVTGGTCSSASPVPANGAGSCTVVVTFAPSSNGVRSGTLTLASDGVPAQAQAALAGTGVGPGNLSLTPGSVDFGTATIGGAAVQRSLTASNGGDVPVALQAPSITGRGYRVASSNCGNSLGPQESCTMEVSFVPTQPAGQSQGSVSVSWQGTGTASGTATSALTGNAVTPGALQFTPNPVQFSPPSVVVGATASMTVSVQNSGGTSVPLAVPSVSGAFAVTNNGCPGSLAPNATCTIQVAFTPLAAGAASGLVIFSSSDGSNSWADGLFGTGAAPGNVAAAPTALSFAPVVIGQTSATQTVTVTNSGDVSVPLNAPRVSSPDYAVAGSSCASTLNPKSSCAVNVSFTPTARGDRSATLQLTSSQSGVASATVALDGRGLAPAQLAFSPAALAFGGHPLRTTSAPQTLNLSNSGDVATPLGIPVLAGQYAIVSNGCGTALGPGASCGIAVQFAPTSAGTQTGALSIASGAGTPSATANLSGKGLTLILSGTIPEFPPTLVGNSVTSPTLLTVENLDSASINLTGLTVTGDFAPSKSSCGGTLAGNSSCSLYVVFKPTAGGIRTGSFTVSNGIETYSAALAGTGLSPATDGLSTNALTFPPTQFGQASPAQAFTLTNTGDAALTQICAYFNSPDECSRSTPTRPFNRASNCGVSLAGHSSCSLAVQFVPDGVGGASSVLTISDYSGVGSSLHVQQVTLSGQGTAPPQPFASPANIDFGSYAYQVATPPKMVTISNPAQSDLTSLNVEASGAGFSITQSTCGQTLSAGTSCQVGVVFNPGAIGPTEGALTTTGNLVGIPEKLTVSLAGSGEEYQLAASCGTFPGCTISSGGIPTEVITNGQMANYLLSITPTGASAGTLAITCAGAPANSVCTANPSTVAVAEGASGSVQLSIATNTRGSAAAGPTAGRWWAAGSVLALLCPLLLFRGEHRRRLLLAAAALLLVASPIACGVHASGNNSGKAGTPAGQTPTGTYTITVNATYPGAQRTATVQLVVQ